MIKILVDSASDISAKEASNLGIEMIPMQVRFGNDEYYDGVTLSAKEFYEKLIESDEFPQTSQINPYRFEEIFKKEVDDGNEIVVITISSKLSGTYLNAVTAAEGFGGRIAVVDSESAAIGERMIVFLAQRLIAKGMSLSEIVDELNDKKKKLRVMAMLNTLEYLKKGGRISSAVALAGKLLSIKPVVGVVDGEVKLIGKAMGSKNAKNLLNTLVEKSGGIDFTMPFGAIWSGLDESVLNKYIADSAHLWAKDASAVPSFMIGSTIGTHVGPGAVGVAFFAKE